MEPAGPFKRDPPAPHELRDRYTATSDVVVLCHFGVPRLDRDLWSLTIDGLVERPLTVDFNALTAYPRTEVAAVHECCGSPFDPLIPTRRVANVRWAGASLADILADCRPRPEAAYVWSYGADSGVFGGVEVDAYVKDLPLVRVPAGVLIAYELNGAPLPAEHGFPARLVVPGFYGTNSVKWLRRITLTDRRAPGPLTSRWYQDVQLDAGGRPVGPPTPVWGIAPEALIVAPADGAAVDRGVTGEIWGWAWADGGVSSVEVHDGAGGWRQAQLEEADTAQWQRFWAEWTPGSVGDIELTARATSISGARQPMTGRRNAVHRVVVAVR
ncbi:molybdopterin-dependent oxidoreductase [Mycolicibacterium pyrenivorans]|uniref:molybdopterin-dependent oxidoreductase n=1 Tax=Mycolicibacterium pyrenivorans TaxID=187102 RepID=UPI0021F2FEEE|nr:molybdopterin-dependent oxidoreductase [Mycolicibacterium pyrenivorans]